jgi:fumarate reductase subunit D
MMIQMMRPWWVYYPLCILTTTFLLPLLRVADGFSAVTRRTPTAAAVRYSANACSSCAAAAPMRQLGVVLPIHNHHVYPPRRSIDRSRISPQQHQLVRRGLSNSNNEFEPLRPESSFGAEAVPKDQRPVNEYMDVTNQPLFGWAATGTKGLLTRLILLYSVVFGAVCYPISGATYTQDGYLVQKLATSNVGAMFVLLLLMIRLFSGWDYIGKRLTSKVIEYEETGWYDGDWEEKTDTELRRDRMLYNSQVKPVVDRLKVFTMSTTGLFVASIVSCNVAMSAKPLVFNQYDPNVLERLSYDDKLADSAAASAGTRPAYCDSRYYRAVANGGLGCNE